MMTTALRLFTVYVGPEDYPDKIVVRGWTVGGGERKQADAPLPDREPLYVGCDLEEARAKIREALPGATSLPRAESDPRAVLEVWL